MEGPLGFCSPRGAVPVLLDSAVLDKGSDRLAHLTKALSGHVLSPPRPGPEVAAVSAGGPQGSHSALFAKNNKSKYTLPTLGPQAERSLLHIPGLPGT